MLGELLGLLPVALLIRQTLDVLDKSGTLTGKSGMRLNTSLVFHVDGIIAENVKTLCFYPCPSDKIISKVYG